MSQPDEYYIWVRDPSGESWHGLKPVTRERGEMLVIKYGKKHPSNHYWIEPVEPPHAEAMRNKAAGLLNEARQISDLIHIAYEPVENAADIEFFQDCAADLERFAFWPVEFAEPLPEGECAHVTPEQACIFCQPKDYDFTDPAQNPYILNGKELERSERVAKAL